MKSNFKKIISNIFFPIPYELKINHIHLNSKKLRSIKAFLQNHYYPNQSRCNKWIKKDLKDHLINRLKQSRSLYIPWLNSVHKLSGSKILEIGCGTGSSTVALAEQKAKVAAIDVSKSALKVAANRLQHYGLNADLSLLNAIHIDSKFSLNYFDFVIFFASLEHMTYQERITSLKKAWKLIKSNGFLVIIETPNRLWFYDNHTSDLPFFHWLPDELAITYFKQSPRKISNRISNKKDPQHELQKLGRGVSFHELELAIMPVQKINIINSLSTFRENLLINTITAFSIQQRYTRFLCRLYPKFHSGFFQPYLNLIIQKNRT